MSWLSKSLNSSIGKKIIMSLTGLFLCSFLVIHLVGNLQLLKDDGGEAFNLYSKFMTSNTLIQIISKLLYATIAGHAAYGLYLAFKNKQARPQAYHSFNNQSTWASRNMGILGTIILVFIGVHMAQFWYVYKFGDLPYRAYANEYGKASVAKDLYKIVYIAFKEVWIVGLYVVSMIALSYHLQHGFKSAFQSLGLNHKKYTPLIKTFGFFFAVIIPAGFAALPLYVYFS